MYNIVVAQLNFVAGAIDENFQKIQAVIKSNPNSNIIFPELSLTGYASEDLYLDLNFVARCESYLSVIAAISDVAGSTVLFGCPIVESEKVYNAAIYCTKGSYKVVHSKIHLPNSGVFDEARYFCFGQQFRTFNFAGKKHLMFDL